MTAAPPALSLQAAYEECRAFTRKRATNFYYAFASLPRAKRNAIYATYAFAGTVDDAVDDAGGEAAHVEQLAAARRLLDAAYGDGAAGDGGDRRWLTAALSDAVRRYAIPRAYFDDLIAGMEQDLSQTRYTSYAELEQYCYRAASVIGLICIEIFGYDRARRDEAVAAAVDMGKALQLTNIMRDVREDAERGRIYLALEDLATFGYDEAALLSFSYSDAFKLLMAEYGTRANAFYESGERLLPLLDSARSRMCCNGLQGVYRSILEEIIRRDYDVYSGRVSPSKAGRLVRLFRLWMSGARPRWAYGSPPA